MPTLHEKWKKAKGEATSLNTKLLFTKKFGKALDKAEKEFYKLATDIAKANKKPIITFEERKSLHDRTEEILLKPDIIEEKYKNILKKESKKAKAKGNEEKRNEIKELYKVLDNIGTELGDVKLDLAALLNQSL